MSYARPYKDDPSILDDDELWRRVPPHCIVRDKDGTMRPSSAAFSDSSNGSAMSVNVLRLRGDSDPGSYLSDHPGHAIAAFTAGLARRLEQGVDHTPDEGGPDHGSVWDSAVQCGVASTRSKSVKKKLARGCRLLLPEVG